MEIQYGENAIGVNLFKSKTVKYNENIINNKTMTAEEARKLTDKTRMLEVDMCSIYHYIDSEIERCATEGKSIVYIDIDVCGDSWETVLGKRNKIIEQYEELGYNIENTGYYRHKKSDTFMITW